MSTVGARSGLAGPPPGHTKAPAHLVRALDSLGLRDAELSPVWKNQAGGLTFSVASAGPGGRIDFYVKWNPAGTSESLTAEAQRLQWLQGRHPAPVAVDLVADMHGEVLLTRALPGESAVAQRWKHQPDTALRALSAGLRRLHRVDYAELPPQWSPQQEPGADGDDTVHRAAESGPPGGIDKLVLSQGDPCAPNTLLAADGSFLAHVDLGRLTVADRWADLAVMTMSLAWNFPRYQEAVFWEGYGMEPDPARIEYYRRLWDEGSGAPPEDPGVVP